MEEIETLRVGHYPSPGESCGSAGRPSVRLLSVIVLDGCSHHHRTFPPIIAIDPEKIEPWRLHSIW